MIIKRIELNNFKSYYGNQTFDFTDGLNIISGEVGTGKTSLYEAFQWILLDDSLIKSNRIEEEFIINKKYESDSIKDEIDKIFVNVSILVSQKGIDYTISKKSIYNYSKDEYILIETKTLIEYVELRTGNAKIIRDNREVDQKLDVLFPENLRRYLLFKGETLDQLIDFSN